MDTEFDYWTYQVVVCVLCGVQSETELRTVYRCLWPVCYFV